MSSARPQGSEGAIHLAAVHLRDYVAQNEEVSYSDVASYARLHTDIDESDHPELIERLEDMGVFVSDRTNPDESSVIEETEPGEDGFIKNNSQIYMVDVANQRRPSRQEELESAKRMHESRREILENIVLLKPVAEQVVDWFSRFQTPAQLAGLLVQSKLNGEEPVKAPTAKHATQKEKIQHFLKCQAEYFDSQIEFRTAGTKQSLVTSFSGLTFLIERNDELLEIFDKHVRELKEALSHIGTFFQNTSYRDVHLSETFLTKLKHQRIDDWVLSNAPLLSERVMSSSYVLERSRQTINLIERKCQLTPVEILRYADNVEESQSAYDKALSKLVDGNLRWVVSLARRYLNQGVHQLDLIQEGNLALVKAARKYDHRSESSFSYFASSSVRDAMQQAYNELSRLIHLPKKLTQTHRIVARVESTLNQELGREATLGEIAERAGLSIQEVRDVVTQGQNVVSLDMPVGDEDGDATLVDLLVSNNLPTPEELAMLAGLRRAVELSLTDLTAREAQILTLRFGIGRYDEMSINELASELNMSPERIRQISRGAIRKLQKPEYTRLLQPYL